MTEADKNILKDACNTRSWESIRRRATQLRRKLISQGVTNVAMLPHKNYNVKIKKEIEDARKKRERN